MKNSNTSHRFVDLFFVQIGIIKKQGWAFWKKILKTTWGIFSGILTVIVTIITIITAFTKESFFVDLFSGYKIDPSSFLQYLLVGLALISIIISIVLHWPKIKVIVKPANNVEIIIECCDLFKQQGLKVVHTTDTFDMERIKPQSLVSQFVSLCNNVSFDINNAIEKGLKEKHFEIDDTLPGRNKRYELGTVCKISDEQFSKLTQTEDMETYCLVAFTHMKVSSVELKIDEYKRLLKKMWLNLSDPILQTKDRTINITVMGNRFINFPTSYNITQKIGYMLEAFFEAMKEKNCCSKLRICVDKEDAADIDFLSMEAIIKYLADRPIQM